MKDLRFTRNSPVDDVTTTIKAHPVRWGECGGTLAVEFVIEQSTYKKWEKRYSPRRSIIFTLPPEDRQALIDMLSESAA